MLLSSGTTASGTAGYVSLVAGSAVGGKAGSVSVSVGTTNSGNGAGVVLGAGSTTDAELGGNIKLTPGSGATAGKVLLKGLLSLYGTSAVTNVNAVVATDLNLNFMVH